MNAVETFVKGQKRVYLLCDAEIVEFIFNIVAIKFKIEEFYGQKKKTNM